MKLYIKEKVFSWAEKFTVREELGQDRYYAEGEFFALAKKLHVYDAEHREVLFIRQRLMHLLSFYEVHIGGRVAAEVAQQFSPFGPAYRINGPGWTVEGSFMAHEFTIRDQRGDLIAQISKTMLAPVDSYELDVPDPENELLTLAIVLAIDCSMASNG